MSKTSVQYGDIYGPSVSVIDAVDFLTTWFDKDDIIVMSGKPVEGGGVVSSRIRVGPLIELLRSDRGPTVLESLCVDRGRKFDTYVNMSPIKEEFASQKGRGTRGQVARVIGLVADFDVKDKGFSSWEHILDFLRGLELVPSIIVSSGSGGAHVYWKLEDGEGLAIEDSKLLTDQFWAYINAEAVRYGAGGVDRLLGVERMYRLPGAVRWPNSIVRLFYCGEGTVSVSDVRRLGEDPYRERQAWRESVRVRERARENQAISTEGMTWEMVVQRDSALQKLSTLPWSWVLGEAGWTWVGQDTDGRQEWARPGKPGAKSMTVDWPESPDVASLFSTAEETGLVDLLEAGIVLTKERVILRLLFGDDFGAMVEWAVTNL